MFLSYLIDPRKGTVEKVRDGFDRAAELTDSTLETDPIWQDLSEPDSSVDLVHSSDVVDEPLFRLRLTHAGKTLERVIGGKGVLVACGSVPDELARQIATADVLGTVIEFPGERRVGVSDWLKSELGSDRWIPAKRAAAGSRRLHSKNVASRK